MCAGEDLDKGEQVLCLCKDPMTGKELNVFGDLRNDQCSLNSFGVGRGRK